MPTLDAIGPATASIDVQAFIEQVEASKQLCFDRLALFRGHLQCGLSTGSRPSLVAVRCSVNDLHRSTTQMYSSDFLRSALLKEHSSRWLTSADEARATEPRPVKRRRGTGDRLSSSKSTTFSEQEESPTPSHPSAASDPTLHDSRWSTLLSELNKTPLRILHPSEHHFQYLRQPRTSDLQILTQVQPARVVSNSKESSIESQSSISELPDLLYTITLHPIQPHASLPHVHFLSVHSNRPLRKQIIHLLGSNTLADLRDNVVAGGGAVPNVVSIDDIDGEEARHDNAESEAEDSSNEDEIGPGTPTTAIQEGCRTIEPALFLEARLAAAKIQWGRKMRKVGSVFAIGGELFADNSAEFENYAKNVLDYIEQASRVSSDTERSNPTRESNTSMSKWKEADRSMQDTKIDSLSLKLGEPYYFLREGNLEHVFTVDEIRAKNELDPASFLNETCQYPITSFLSRDKSLQRCYICDRDPESVIVLNDSLAGRSPAIMCTKCFDVLHAHDMTWPEGDGSEGSRAWRKIELVSES